MGLLIWLDLWPAVTARDRICREVSFSVLQLEREVESNVLFTQSRDDLVGIVIGELYLRWDVCAVNNHSVLRM